MTDSGGRSCSSRPCPWSTTSPRALPDWLEDAREQIAAAGEYFAFSDGADTSVVALDEGWTRIGRSLSADIRFDDPTVSRRHALVYREPTGGTRILDDRSLNGVFLNGDRVELQELEDGDRIAVGTLHPLLPRGARRRSRRDARAALGSRRA